MPGNVPIVMARSLPRPRYEESRKDSRPLFRPYFAYGPTKALAASLDPARRKDLMRDFIAYHDGFRSELGVAMPRDYLVTIGVRK